MRTDKRQMHKGMMREERVIKGFCLN